MNDFNLKEIILFEDEDLIVLNKPSGLLSIEDGYNREKINLRSVLRDTYRAIWTIHRLDKDTSGVIIFAKNEESHRILNSSFLYRKTKKKYRTIINGLPIWDSFEINLPLRINGDRKHRTVIDPNNGKPAFTRFVKLNSQEGYSYLDIFPMTGLTHQIRAHLSAIGFPILGDHLYWHCYEIKKFSNLHQEKGLLNYFLHAFSLEFTHPILRKPMLISAPLPISFSQMLEKLKINC